MWATNAQATALAIVASKSFASLRQRPSHAKVRSTTHLRGGTSKPCAVSERLIISIVHSPIRFSLQSLLQFISAIATIGKDMAQPGIARTDRSKDAGGAIAILNAGFVPAKEAARLASAWFRA